MSHLLARKPTRLSPRRARTSVRTRRLPTISDPASNRACVPLRSTFGAAPCHGGADSGTRAKTPGPVVSPPAVRLRGPHLAASAPAPGLAALLPSRRLRAGRLIARPVANSDLPEIGTPADLADALNDTGTNPASTARHPQATASTSSRAPRLMQPLALGGSHAAHAQKLGRVRRLASPSACAGLLRRHRFGYRLARLRPSRDFTRTDKISSS